MCCCGPRGHQSKQNKNYVQTNKHLYVSFRNNVPGALPEYADQPFKYGHGNPNASNRWVAPSQLHIIPPSASVVLCSVKHAYKNCCVYVAR